MMSRLRHVFVAECDSRLSSRPFRLVPSAFRPNQTASRFPGARPPSVMSGTPTEEVDPRRVRMKGRNRDALLDQLVERALDVSPFVR